MTDPRRAGPSAHLSAAPVGLRSDLNWCRRLTSDGFAGHPAVFLDRDGVVIVDRNYLGDPDGVELLEGAAATVRRVNAAGAALVIVTNQSGIGRGYFSWDDYAAVERRMLAVLADAGARIDMILACPFHPSALPPYDRDDSWRKPSPGMLLEAIETLGLDRARSVLVGDKASDIEAAHRTGLPAAYLLASECDRADALVAQELASEAFVVEIRQSLAGLAPDLSRWLD